MPEELSFTSVASLFIFSLLALFPQNQRMDGSCMSVSGIVGCGLILISHDWICCLVPHFREMGKCPNFRRKI